MGTTVIVDQPVGWRAELFFVQQPRIVDGVERWQRALAGNKRDQQQMRALLEDYAITALALLDELREAEKPTG